MMYWIKTNTFIKKLFSRQIWSVPNLENTIYLTFDDGPTPEVTEWVLETLQQYDTKATFFCIGKNIVQHPEIYKKIIAQGHAIGNHTNHHVNGWKTATKKYLGEVNECATIINTFASTIQEENTVLYPLFRPPYGKITPIQSKKIRSLGYKIIMWDILTADFDPTIAPEQCYENAIQKVENGSIIVFHDSNKAYTNLKYVLPKALAYYKNKGFQLETLC